MNASTITSALRDVWYLVILLAVIAGVVVYKIMVPAESSESVPQAGPVSVAGGAQTPLPAAATEPQAARPTEPEKTQETIKEYQQRLDNDAKDPDAPALLNAMANLSRQKLGDYKAAAGYYELLITNYPDWEGIARVYPQLATCYERIGDAQAMQNVYKRMLQKFPPDTQEYLYAKSELGI